MSVSRELQTAILNALVADAGVGALVGDRIYDGMPSNGQYPCITVGPTDSFNEDLACVDARTETVQLDVWSRDQGRMGPCKDICDAVKDALHLADITLTQHALIRIRTGGIRVFRDADGITAHGVVTVEADLEEING
ncbi:MAG: hypothetical protein VR71_02165 [Roseovarius sp. BRH_c41]|uniref:DUF3168 domain-containing protein n=1 Tax=Roseovarius sp. BRH_c41 TaxID=1629709 RepID=UPI0005F0DD6B|nr:DUF3168 domain-containing protein [Roseovarius sp. BRH_c41]KJS45240.1 MAG: hypothetical protein VR71_02165 [Roseovarius sp. BRH_c41]